MNRKNRVGVSLLVMLMIIAGCASKKNDDGKAHSHDGENVWTEMDDFHMIMAETFHPYKDSTNLEPAKRRASELMEAAEEWASAELPRKVDNDEVRSSLRQLKAEAARLAEAVKSADDNVIGEQLTDLHDTFHEIQEAWYGGH